VTADGTGDGVPELAPPALFVVGVTVLGIVIVGVTALAIVGVSVVGVPVVLRCGWLIARVVRVMVGVDGEVVVGMVVVRMVVVKRVGHGMHFLPLRNQTCLS